MTTVQPHTGKGNGGKAKVVLPLEDEVPVVKETKQEKFVRLAKKRMDAALKRIGLVGNLADGAYEHTKEQETKLMTALFDAVHDVKRRFERRSGGHQGFNF